jgi:hypothetical protein
MTEGAKYRFKREDPGNCRVYYTRDRRLFCIQDEGRAGRKDHFFYACSPDGEPSHQVAYPPEEEFDVYKEP